VWKPQYVGNIIQIKSGLDRQVLKILIGFNGLRTVLYAIIRKANGISERLRGVHHSVRRIKDTVHDRLSYQVVDGYCPHPVLSRVAIWPP
jgi:hypothetical protein